MHQRSLIFLPYFWTVLLALSLCLAQHGGAFTWGYPSNSPLGQCLESTPYDYVLFPDRNTALATVQAEVAAAQAYCASLPNPKPSWCSYIYYYEWSCAYQSIPACSTTCQCTSTGCPGVTDCGFACYNCRDYGVWENGNWKKTWYWYYVCSPTYPPPSQVMDPPITTEMTDRNAGGECEGTCNTTINDSRGGR